MPPRFRMKSCAPKKHWGETIAGKIFETLPEGALELEAYLGATIPLTKVNSSDLSHWPTTWGRALDSYALPEPWARQPNEKTRQNT